MSKETNILKQAQEALADSAIPAGPSENLIRQTLEKIENEPNKIPLLERILKMKPLIKYAAAAIILVGLSTIFLFPTGRESIALASVYSKIQQAQSFMYKMSMTMTGMGEITGQPDMDGTMEMDMTVTMSSEYGMKMENHMKSPTSDGKTQNITQFAYLLPEDKVMVSIMPNQKMYQTIEFTDELLEQTQKKNNDPRQMIKEMMESEYIELEQTEINGVKVQGFQTTDPAISGGISEDCTATLWVDVKTWMPVKYEIDMKMGKSMETHCVINEFLWDVPISAADFEYTIPDDYTEFGSMKMPEMNADAAIEGLRTYREFFGQYPEKLDLMSLMTDIQKIRQLDSETAIRFCQKMESAGGDQAKMQEFMQELMSPLQSLGMFQMQLVQQKKDPAYYGDQVTPDDTDAVLMRWKADSGKYTVVFGDLTVTEMEYNDLLEIEPESLPDQETARQAIAESANEIASAQLRLDSSKNIKQLLLACALNARNNEDQWPEQLQDLEDIEPQTFVNPADPGNPNGYIYIRPQSDSLNAQTVVIYEAYHDWNEGINVGFADGRVLFIKNQTEFLELLNQ